MKAVTEMRKFTRDDFDTPVIYSDDEFATHHSGFLHNMSDDGFYLESDEKLEKGAEIYLKTEHFRSVNRCEVVWCNALEEDGVETGLFGVGLHCEF